MKLNSFRELLLIKAKANNKLQELIKNIDQATLDETVVEYLEKMAIRREAQANHVSPYVHKFLSTITPDTPELDMIHDALSHHVSRYKAALSGGQSKAANEHAYTLLKLMDLYHNMQSADRNKIGKGLVVSVRPWLANVISGVSSDLPGWNRPKKTLDNAKALSMKARLDHPKGKSYGNLLYEIEASNPKSGEASDKVPINVRGGYPFEHIRVGTPGNMKHLHIEDVPTPTKYEPHEFDHHPIMLFKGNSSTSGDIETDPSYQQYSQQLDKWNQTHANSWFDRHAALVESNPEEYSKRGASAPKPIHPDHAEPLKFEHEKTSEPSSQVTVPSKAGGKAVSIDTGALGGEYKDLLSEIIGSSAPATPTATPATKGGNVSDIFGPPPGQTKKVGKP